MDLPARAAAIGDACQAALEAVAAGDRFAVRRLIDACGGARDFADELAERGEKARTA